MSNPQPASPQPAARSVAARALGWAGALVLPLAVATALFILITESPQTLRAIRLDFGLVALSFLVMCAGLMVAIPIWRHLLGRFGVRASWRDDIRIYCYSALGFILPGGVWSILSRSGHYQRLGFNGLRVAAASVVETLLVGVAATVVYALVVLFQPGLSLWQRPEFGLMLAALALVLLHPRLFNPLARWAWRRSQRQPGADLARFGYPELLLWVALEAVVIFIGGLALYVLLNSLLPAPNALPHSVAAWASAAAASNLFFWLPGTAIIRDGVVVLALAALLPVSLALVFVGVLRIWTIVSLLIVAGAVWVALDMRASRAT